MTTRQPELPPLTPEERASIECMIELVFGCIERGEIEGNAATHRLWGGVRNLLAERDALAADVEWLDRWRKLWHQTAGHQTAAAWRLQATAALAKHREAHDAGRREAFEEAANLVLYGDIHEVYATGDYAADDVEADTRAHAAAAIRALAAAKPEACAACNAGQYVGHCPACRIAAEIRRARRGGQ